MASITIPNTFVTGNTILASEMNANFTAITAQVNGNLDATNLANSAVTENKIANAAVTDGKVASGINAAKIGTGVVSNTEFSYLDGVTSSIQTQLNAKEGAITLTANRAVESDGTGAVTASAVTATELGYLSGVTSAIQTQISSLDSSKQDIVAGVSDTEIGYLDGVTSAIQTQLNAKQPTITGAATTIDNSNLTASRALVSDGSGKVGVSAVTSTELSRLDGVTSNVQTQIDGILRVRGLTSSSAGSKVAGSASLSVSKISTGRYEITHNIGDSNGYVAHATPLFTDAIPWLSAVNANTVEVYFSTGDVSFHFTLLEL